MGFLGRQLIWTSFLVGALAVVVFAFAQWYTATYCSTKLPPAHFAAAPYNGHLDLTFPINHPATRVLHVSKEFGPASMGGLGTMLTALVTAQSLTQHTRPSVVIPHYSYLSKQYGDAIEPFTSVTIGVSSWLGQHQNVSCRISTLRLPLSFEAKDGYVEVQEGKMPNSTQRDVLVYLIGVGDRYPFENAFDVDGAYDIYSAPPPLPQEWKDLYFVKAVATLVDYISSPGASAALVVHLHGATNALVACYLHRKLVPVVYTLHDYLDEVEYSNRLSNLAKFVESNSCVSNTALASYSSCRRFFASALAIDLADVVTFVSRTVAEAMVLDKFAFQSNSRVMPSLLRKNALGAFVGVTNGLDYGDPSRNPFLAPKLLEAGLAFPSVETAPAGAFSASKRRARDYLSTNHPEILPLSAVNEPLILFVGRFQHDKGCDFFESLLLQLEDSTSGGYFIALGTPNNYPHHRLTGLQKRFSHSFSLLDDPNIQLPLGSILRMAADFVFVPSFAESFGLVAAEGLLFGSAVISTGVGGLKEFLKNNPADGGSSGNSYLFSMGQLGLASGRTPVSSLAKAECRKAVRRALGEWMAMDIDGKEERVRHLMKSTEGLRWGSVGGAVDQYAAVYRKAIAVKSLVHHHAMS